MGLAALVEPQPNVKGSGLRSRARIHGAMSLTLILFAVGLGMGLVPVFLPGPHVETYIFWAGVLAVPPYLLAYRWSRQGRLDAAASALAFTSTSALLFSSVGQTALAFYAINGVIISSAISTPTTSARAGVLVSVGSALLWFDPGVDMALLPFVLIGNIGQSMLLFLASLYVANQDAERRAADERTRLMMQDAPDAIFTLSNDGVVELCNPAAEALCGVDVVALQGSRVQALGLCTDEDLERVRSRGYVLQHGRIERADGTERQFEAHWSLRDDGISASVRDTTEQAAARDREAKLQRALEESRRLETIGRLAGGVAHDFNNQLTVIYSASSMISREEDEELVTLIEEACEHATALTRQLLRFAREKPEEVQVFSSQELVEDLRRMLGALVRESVRLDLQLAPGGFVRLDPTHLRQALINVIANASDAMPDGGTIRITTELIASPELESGAVRGPAGQVRISVSDEGLGMSAETVERIFEPFYTTKEVGAGTGLGLATAFGIVTEAGGTIDVQSEPDVGTTFVLSLPRYAELEPEPEVVQTESASDLAGLRVLVVDDLAALGRTTRAALDAAGLQTTFAHGPAEALEWVEGQQRPFDLLVSDVVMPGMSGPRLAVQIRKSLPGIRVLFVSGYTASEDLGGEALLRKPYSTQTLLARLAQVWSQPSV